MHLYPSNSNDQFKFNENKNKTSKYELQVIVNTWFG